LDNFELELSRFKSWGIRMLSQLGALRRSCCEKERGDNGRFVCAVT
jgi:hypothetical protein